MGWSSGTDIFDVVYEELVVKNSSKEDILEKLIDVLEDKDWDCHNESEYYDDPVVQKLMLKLHPDWVEDYEEDEI